VIGQHHTLAALYPRERPGTHFTGGWLGPIWTGGKSRPHRDSICMQGTVTLFVWHLWQNLKCLYFAQEMFVFLRTTDCDSILCGGGLKFGKKGLAE